MGGSRDPLRGERTGFEIRGLFDASFWNEWWRASQEMTGRVLDADTDSDPTLVIGSTDWSVNGEDVNAENLVVIHDRALANQARQEFEARWESSGCRE